MIFLIVLLFLAGSWLFKYPNTLSTPVEVTLNPAPIEVQTTQAGQIVKRFVQSQARVKVGAPIFLIQSTEETPMIAPVGGTVLFTRNWSEYQRVKRGEFRTDLFYRLHVIPVYLPPLRKREGDIALLTQHFLQQYDTPISSLDPRALEALQKHTWPGNVRELKHCIETAVLLWEGNDRRFSIQCPPLIGHEFFVC